MPVRTSSILGGVLSGFATWPIARWGVWPQCCLRPSAPTPLINDYSLYLFEVEKSGEDRAVDFPVFAVYYGEGEAQVLMRAMTLLPFRFRMLSLLVMLFFFQPHTVIDRLL